MHEQNTEQKKRYFREWARICGRRGKRMWLLTTDTMARTAVWTAALPPSGTLPLGLDHEPDTTA